MKVDPADLPLHLIKANVIEPLKTGPVDRPHPVVGHKKVLFPPHEDVLPLGHVLDQDLTALTRLLSIGTERRKLSPVGEINLVCCAPGWVLCDEAVLGADNLAFKIGRKCWVVIGQTCRTRISGPLRGLLKGKLVIP